MVAGGFGGAGLAAGGGGSEFPGLGSSAINWSLGRLLPIPFDPPRVKLQPFNPHSTLDTPRPVGADAGNAMPYVVIKVFTPCLPPCICAAAGTPFTGGRGRSA